MMMMMMMMMMIRTAQIVAGLEHVRPRKGHESGQSTFHFVIASKTTKVSKNHCDLCGNRVKIMNGHFK